MMRALYTAATGMAAQQRNIDTTANNLANVNTTGYKKSKVHFQDLLYHNERTAGVPSSVSTQVPVGLHVGHGVKFIGTEKIHTQGNLENTGNDLDLSNIPQDTRKVEVGFDGTVTVFLRDETMPEAIGSIQLARFQNPAGLTPIGKNLYVSTPASGNAIVDAPGASSMGTLTQGFLERSNVSLVEEMVNMITSQRAYEVNSKAIQSADEMLKNTNNLVR